MYQFPRDAETRYFELGGLRHQTFLAQLCRLEVQNQGVGRTGSDWKLRGTTFPMFLSQLLLVVGNPHVCCLIFSCVSFPLLVIIQLRAPSSPSRMSFPVSYLVSKAPAFPNLPSSSCQGHDNWLMQFYTFHGTSAWDYAANVVIIMIIVILMANTDHLAHELGMC